MSIIKDTYFGGAEKKAATAQTDALGRAQETVQQSSREAKTKLEELFKTGSEQSRAGFQQALDIFGQTIPQQANLFGGGNVAAQQTQIAGLNPTIAALQGLPVNLGGLQPTQLPVDMSFAQQSLPTLPQQQNSGLGNLSQNNLQQLFGGGGGTDFSGGFGGGGQTQFPKMRLF